MTPTSLKLSVYYFKKNIYNFPMDYGFIRSACASPKLIVGNCSYNAQQIIKCINETKKKNVNIFVFPELCICGCTCGDLFFQKTLQEECIKSIEYIAKETSKFNCLILVGSPIYNKNSLYNCAIAIFKGKILAVIPKTLIHNYGELNEYRYFNSALGCDLKKVYLSAENPEIPFGTDIILEDSKNPLISIAVELSDDLTLPLSPSAQAVMQGATIVANLSASNEIVGRADYRKLLICSQSKKTTSVYLYANASKEESTTDLVFSGHNLIVENGKILKESNLFKNETIISDIDLELISQDRKKTTGSINNSISNSQNLRIVNFDLDKIKSSPKTLERTINPYPFIPSNDIDKSKRFSDIINLQINALAKRILHINAKSVVIGLSGGLDSTLALLIVVKTFELLNKDKNSIIAITMPGFGTTDRTYNNACLLAKELKVSLKEVKITDAIIQHFKDINHDINIHDVTYENSQARERTQILMDIANKEQGLVVGTGDLSELALGWATYNGDQMSMYGINSSIPKTLVKHLVNWIAEQENNNGNTTVFNVLKDVLNTPVSPELLPPTNNNISQKTENIVGPYELHDFFIYYALRYGFSPRKIFFLAKNAFTQYSNSEIKKWLISFYKRFFSQQFKRSCMPDGVKVGTVGLSPRGDLRMPSDASSEHWIKELDSLEC